MMGAHLPKYHGVLTAALEYIKNNWGFSILAITTGTEGLFSLLMCTVCGPGSSVGITTDYGLEGPGLNPSGDEILRPSRPALWPTQPPVK